MRNIILQWLAHMFLRTTCLHIYKATANYNDYRAKTPNETTKHKREEATGKMKD